MSQFIYVNVIGFPGGNLEPVKSILEHGTCFKIIDENSDDEHFPLEFETGEVVTCEKVRFYEEEYGFVAKRKCKCNA